MNSKISSVVRCLVIFMIAGPLWCCRGLREASVVSFVVREAPGTLITKPAIIEFQDTLGSKSIGPFNTNAFGFLALSKDSLEKIHKMNFNNLVAKASYENKSATITTDKFNNFYDIYLDPVKIVHDTLRTADMHYHVSLRTYNAFGNDLYGNTKIPKNINWLRNGKFLCVYDGTRWSKISLLEAQTNDSKLRTYLMGNWVRPAEGANNLKHFTEATFPHSLEGNVYLAYNAISPFEHGLTNEGVKRVVSSAMKSGADIDWLRMLGKDDHITHWQNFLAEYKMITGQSRKFNNYEWQTFQNRDNVEDLLKKGPVVVNVVEGAHIFQDKYFPHAINFDLMDTTSQFKKDLFDDIHKKAKSFAVSNRNDARIASLFDTYLGKSDVKKDSLVNCVLMQEVLNNVDTFKKLNVHMISISHLSYNGMTGHAPALDVSKKPALENFTSYLAKRAFGIRVSNDKKYKKSYDGLFYRVPGVNQFGDSVISRLLDIRKGGKRVHLDLKHADVITRRHILDRYENETMKSDDKIKFPPMCSHCAVNGLSIDYTSPLLNEYSLLRSSLARKFYPFAINLYNEEIERMVALGGMIGIPLEERVLGGYIDNNQDWYVGIGRAGGAYVRSEKGERCKRLKYTEKVLHYLSQDWVKCNAYDSVESFYIRLLKKDNLYREMSNESAEEQSAQKKQFFQMIFEEYTSAEPFLQNVFHIVDIARKTNEKIRQDSTAANASKIMVNLAIDSIRANNKDVNQLIEESGRKANQEIRRTPLDQEQRDRVTRQAENFTANNVIDTLLQNSREQYKFQGKVELQTKQMINTMNFVKLDSLAKREAWKNICLGSDFDGMIDPLNICPTASQFPIFREKLKVFIPLFLYIRQEFEVKDRLLSSRYQGKDDYFDKNFRVDDALHLLFYDNLKKFTLENFK